jgi:hypothetical protein
MKRILLLLISLLAFIISLQGQQKLEVVASAGGYNVAPGGAISVSWTLGETIIPNYVSQDGSIGIAHGFQQKLVITRIEESIENPVSVTIYPNPVSDIVRVVFDQPVESPISVTVVDFRGRRVDTGMIATGTTLYEIDMQGLPAGLYYLRLQKGMHINAYRVVKL